LGEIRDGETARLALQAALTGHLVLTTLHTNDATGAAVARLIDMGCEPFLVNATVLAVLAQRLLRQLCPACRKYGEDTLDKRRGDAFIPQFFRHAAGTDFFHLVRGENHPGYMPSSVLLIQLRNCCSAGR